MSFFEKYKFWIKCGTIVFSILVLVFSFYIFQFLIGNHDWRFLRYGVPFDAGFGEGRVSQFFIPWVLFEGKMLPCLEALTGIGFFTAAIILLAKWYELPKKYGVVVLFALMIGLHPYLLTQFYYAHSVCSIFFWYLCCMVGMLFCWKFTSGQGKKYLLLGNLLIFVAAIGYVSSLQMVFVCSLAKVLIDFLKNERVCVGYLKKVFFYFLIILLIVFETFLMMEMLKKTGIINSAMYNVQILSLQDVWHKFQILWKAPFIMMLFPTGFEKKWVLYLLPLLCLCVLMRTLFVSRIKFFISSIFLVTILYVSFIFAYFSPYDAFHMFRVNVYSVPFLFSIVFALVFVPPLFSKFLSNVAFLCALLFVIESVKTDVITQKVWFLGDKQDSFAVERIKADILPKMNNKFYRLVVLGGLYGRMKFAQQPFLGEGYNEIMREYYGFSYLHMGASSILFGYEGRNPIWGEAVYAWGDFTFNVSNEQLTAENEDVAYRFAQQFGNDAKHLLLEVRKLGVFPKNDYNIVGEKDVIIRLNQEVEMMTALERKLEL